MRYPTWQHFAIRATNRTGLERLAALHLGPALDKSVNEGVITGYHFLRKDGGGMRLRVCPNDEGARVAVENIVAELTTAGHIANWMPGIYEPETLAFGGAAAMDAAHELFCQDSYHILNYLSAQHEQHSADTSPATSFPGRREMAVLLASSMMRLRPRYLRAGRRLGEGRRPTARRPPYAA